MNGERLSSTSDHTWQKAGSEKEGKSARTGSKEQPAQPSKCPECGKSRIWKDGLRYVKTEIGELPVQRYLCRTCGRRFSETSEPQIEIHVSRKVSKRFHPGSDLAEKSIGNRNLAFEKSSDCLPLQGCENVRSHSVTVVGKQLNSLCSYSSKRQVCVSGKEMKNLSHQRTRQKQAAGATKLSKEEVNGKIIQLAASLLNNGVPEGTVNTFMRNLITLSKRVNNLMNPEEVKELIARRKWKPKYKNSLVLAYDHFATYWKITWTPPHYKVPESFPFVPLEEEVDQVIAALPKKLGTFVQTIKETGARPGEIRRQVRWTDIHKESGTIIIRTPEKGSRPRVLDVSANLIERIQMLPRNHEYVFPASKKSFYIRWGKRKKAIAHKLNNPRILKMTMTSLRHLKGTMEYHKTRDILHVMKILGHKDIKSTLVYIDLEHAIFRTKNDQFTVKVAETPQEITQLLEVGFEYVCEKDGLIFLRKRK